MAEQVTPGQPVPVLAATQSRLSWRAVASWLQAIGATAGALIAAASQYQTAITPLIPIKYAGIAAAVFAIGKTIEAVQKQKDVTRDKPLVNLSDPTGGPQ